MFKSRILFFFLIFSASSCASIDPSYWPWRGVNIPVDILEREDNIITELKKAKINAVRIQLNYKKLMNMYNLDKGGVLKLSIKMADELLDKLKKNKMTAVFGIENFPQENLKCKSKLDSLFWKTQRCLDTMYSVTETVTSHFNNRGLELAAYQFISEPVVQINGKGKRPHNWIKIQKKLLKIVEKNDPSRFFVITAGPWGSPQGYKEFEAFPSKKVIYNAHFFQPKQYTHQGVKKNDFNVKYPGLIRFRYWDKDKLEDVAFNLIEFQKKHDVPVLIGSFSKMNWINDNNQWLKDTLNVFEKNNWGWLYYIVGAEPWKGWDPRYIGNYKEKKFIPSDNTKTWDVLKEYFLKNNKLE